MKILVCEKLRGVEVKICEEQVQAHQRKGSSRSKEARGKEDKGQGGQGPRRTRDKSKRGRIRNRKCVRRFVNN